jgi:ABC-type sugar transport system substrate-binding protein
MNLKLTAVSGLTLSLLAAAAASCPTGFAQDAENSIITIPDAIDGQFSQSSGTFFENRSIGRQAGRMFGFGYPEREIDWDAATLAESVDTLFLLQNTVDPTIRVPDLANPYTTTLLTMPSGTAPTVGSEFIFEPF